MGFISTKTRFKGQRASSAQCPVGHCAVVLPFFDDAASILCMDASSMRCHLVVLAQASAMLVGSSKLIGSLLCLIIIYLAGAAFQFVFVYSVRRYERYIGTLLRGATSFHRN